MCRYYSSFIGNWATDGEKEDRPTDRTRARAGRGGARSRSRWESSERLSSERSSVRYRIGIAACSHQTLLPGGEGGFNRNPVDNLDKRETMYYKWYALFYITLQISSFGTSALLYRLIRDWTV